MTTQIDIQASLPLTEVTYFILLSLAPEPKHGYAIMKDVQARSDIALFWYRHVVWRAQAAVGGWLD